MMCSLQYRTVYVDTKQKLWLGAQSAMCTLGAAGGPAKRQIVLRYRETTVTQTFNTAVTGLVHSLATKLKRKCRCQAEF